MNITNKELDLIGDVCFYLGELKGEKAQELYKNLCELDKRLCNRRNKRNELNTKRIMEKRRLDKNYARTKFKNIGI